MASLYIFILLFLTFSKEIFIWDKKNSSDLPDTRHHKKKMIKFSNNHTNFNCVNFAQKCRKSALIDRVEFMHTFFNLISDKRRICKKLFEEFAHFRKFHGLIITKANRNFLKLHKFYPISLYNFNHLWLKNGQN